MSSLSRGRQYAQYGFAGLPGGEPSGSALRRGQSVIVGEWEQGLLFRNGKFQRALEPGRHRFWPGGCSVRTVDLRAWVLALPTQEVPTADGATVKVTVSGQVRITDAIGYLTSARQPEQSIYLVVQVALRDLLAGITVDELLADRGALGERLLAGVSGADRFGVSIDQLVIKDIMLSGELKKAQAEVLIARAQGLAALERARGETAALRSLANAAKLVAGSPALLQLRLLQQLGNSAGHTVVIGTPAVAPFGREAAAVDTSS